MNYQLVLQFREDDCLDFDALFHLEDELQRLVAPIADVDGHDMGSGEMNIFILTADPVATFARAKPLLADASLLDNVRVAYRELHSDDFAFLWPTGPKEAFVVA